jgi:hypothetical protein
MDTFQESVIAWSCCCGLIKSHGTALHIQVRLEALIKAGVETSFNCPKYINAHAARSLSLETESPAVAADVVPSSCNSTLLTRFGLQGRVRFWHASLRYVLSLTSFLWLAVYVVTLDTCKLWFEPFDQGQFTVP